MLDNPINGFTIPAGIEVMAQFKVCGKRGRWRWMRADIMSCIFKHQHVVVLRSHLIMEFLNAIFKAGGIVLVTGKEKGWHADFAHSLCAMNIIFTTPGGKELRRFPAWVYFFAAAKTGIEQTSSLGS